MDYTKGVIDKSRYKPYTLHGIDDGICLSPQILSTLTVWYFSK